MTGQSQVFYIESDMFSKDDELSPDLVWMLQSDQVDDATLTAALVQNYYPRIYRKALARLIYPEDARRIAQETIIQAVHESATYRGPESVSQWLDGIARLKIAEKEVSIHEQQMLNPRLIRSMSVGQHWEILSPGEIERETKNIIAGVKQRTQQRRKRITSQVLGLLGMITLVVMIMVGGQYYRSPENQVESLQTGDQEHQPTSTEISATQPAKEQVEEPQLREPLDLFATSPEIRERILSSREYWDTMWAEVLITYYGPQSYDGPAIQERHQLWVDPQRGSMLVSGPVDEFPILIERFNIPGSPDIGGPGMTGDLITRVGSQVPWFAINFETLVEMPYVLNFLAKSTMWERPTSISYAVRDEQEWAGVKTLVVDLYVSGGHPLGRLNIDPLTGIALREQYYDPDWLEKTIIESNVIQIEYNQPMPTMWKRLDYDFLASNYFSTKPIESAPVDEWSLQLAPPSIPDNFLLEDPSQSKLVFKKSEAADNDAAGFSKYELFAGEIYLGDIHLLDPLRMICTRSPGGNRFAFAKCTFYPPEENENVYWFDLDELQIHHYELPDVALQLVWIGFSPDDRYLALSGFNEKYQHEFFYILDTTSGTMRMLPIPGSYNRKTWSQDGTQILVLEEAGSSFEAETARSILVYSADDGDLMEKIEVTEIPNRSNELVVPINGWEAEFDLGLQDIASCTAPPGY